MKNDFENQIFDKVVHNLTMGDIVKNLMHIHPTRTKNPERYLIKGLTDALTLKLSKNTDVKIEDDKLEDLVKTIEHDLYVFYSRDVGNKYRAKYRSLVFNIKDEKNNGLFRKIINGTIAPKKLVEMSVSCIFFVIYMEEYTFKGQEISKDFFCVFKYSKKTTKCFTNFCPSP